MEKFVRAISSKGIALDLQSRRRLLESRARRYFSVTIDRAGDHVTFVYGNIVLQQIVFAIFR